MLRCCGQLPVLHSLVSFELESSRLLALVHLIGKSTPSQSLISQWIILILKAWYMFVWSRQRRINWGKVSQLFWAKPTNLLCVRSLPFWAILWWEERQQDLCLSVMIANFLLGHVKKALELAGVKVAEFNGHSFRIGAASTNHLSYNTKPQFHVHCLHLWCGFTPYYYTTPIALWRLCHWECWPHILMCFMGSLVDVQGESEIELTNVGL